MEGSLLKDKYKIFSVVKPADHGSVYKAFYFKYFQVRWCAIKEAANTGFADPSGIERSARLVHQINLYNTLKTVVPLASCIDLFEENSKTYLVTRWHKGPTLEDKTACLFRGLTWTQLSVIDRLQILNFLISVIQTVQLFHTKGYVHRDLNPANFVFDHRNTLRVIDLELTYSLNRAEPTPLFGIGTYGFTSPEQEAMQTPTIKEDIYGLGGLMIFLFTSLPPIRFDLQTAKLEGQLRFFIQEPEILLLILPCLAPLPADRPDLANVLTGIKTIQAITQKKPPVEKLNYVESENEIRDCIQRGLKGFDGTHVYDVESISPGFQNGRAGILYTLARNFSIDQTAFQFPDLQNLDGGLFYGAAGVALSLAETVRTGSRVNDREMADFLTLCLSKPVNGFSLSSGSAGVIVALVNCRLLMDPTVCQDLLADHVNRISSAWNQLSKSTPYWANGLAGVLWSLLEHYNYSRDQQVYQTVSFGLGQLEKFVVRKTRMDSPWLHDGAAGIALCFLRAYQVFKNQKYKCLAENILRQNPPYPSSPIFGQEGLAGLGEVYIEAYQSFGNSEWKDRAIWIGNILCQTLKSGPNNTGYWVTGAGEINPDFHSGTAGILHFLIRLSGEHKFPYSA